MSVRRDVTLKTEDYEQNLIYMCAYNCLNKCLKLLAHFGPIPKETPTVPPLSLGTRQPIARVPQGRSR